jgi:phosphatidylglycerol---prolipoprotein diacylglyceryl transferase
MYGLMLAISMLIGYGFVRRQMIKRFALSEHVVDLFLLLLILGSLMGARLFALIFEMKVPFSRILGCLVRFQPSGVTFYGGFLMALPILIGFILRYHINFLELADILTLPTAFGLGLTRVGCFLAGCCWGRPADVPWAVTFTHPESLAGLKNLPLHPVQLYHSSVNFLIFGILCIITFSRRSSSRGVVFALFLLLYSTGRFFTEYFRGDHYRGFVVGGLSTGQFISLWIFAAGLLCLCVIRRRSRATSRGSPVVDA